VSEPTHTLRITIYEGSDERPVSSIVCSDPENCGPIWHEPSNPWPDEISCNCNITDCPCRRGEHDDCIGDSSYVEDLGWSCRLEPERACWYAHAVAEVGWEMLQLVCEGDDDAFVVDVPVHLSGGGFDEPIEFTPIAPGS